MRFLIQEQPYETPMAAGLLRYEQDGRATGAVEYWRLTSAVSGYRLLRVDLDAREAASGDSYLYHLVMAENGRFERLTYRFYGKQVEVRGTVLFEEQVVTAVRKVKQRGAKSEERREDEVVVPAGYGFWFPSSVGLGLLWFMVYGAESKTAVSLQIVPSTQYSVPSEQYPVNSEQLAVNSEQSPISNLQSPFALFATEIKLERSISEQLHIEWEDQQRTLWLNEQGHVMKMQRGDGLTAVETRYVQYS